MFTKRLFNSIVWRERTWLSWLWYHIIISMTYLDVLLMQIKKPYAHIWHNDITSRRCISHRALNIMAHTQFIEKMKSHEQQWAAVCVKKGQFNIKSLDPSVSFVFSPLRYHRKSNMKLPEGNFRTIVSTSRANESSLTWAMMTFPRLQVKVYCSRICIQRNRRHPSNDLSLL